MISESRSVDGTHYASWGHGLTRVSLQTFTGRSTEQRCLEAQRGQGLVEYAILAALISIAAVSLVFAIGQQVLPLFNIPLNAL